MRTWLSAICSAVFAASLVGTTVPALAQGKPKFPSKPVRLVIGFSPGSATDLSGRMVAQKLESLWGQPVVIENRSGAGGQLAAVMVAKSTPDGYTLLMISSAMVVNSVLPVKPMYDILKEFTGVAQIGVPTSVVLVNPGLGVKSLKELIALGAIVDTGKKRRVSLQSRQAKLYKFGSGVPLTPTKPETALKTETPRIPAWKKDAGVILKPLLLGALSFLRALARWLNIAY